MSQKEIIKKPLWLTDLEEYFEQNPKGPAKFTDLPGSVKAEYDQAEDAWAVDLSVAIALVQAKTIGATPYEEDVCEIVPEIGVCLGIESIAAMGDLPVRQPPPLAQCLAKWRETLETYTA